MKVALKLYLFFFLCIAFLPAPLMAANEVQVATGFNFSLALHEDGTVWGWGSNEFGQIGVPGSVEYHTPVQVTGPGGIGYLTDIISIAAGFDFALALKRDGSTWAWGGNSSGQLGIGSTQSYNYPVQVKNSSGTDFLSGVKGIACGYGHSLALLQNGSVWAWGDNSKHQLNSTAGATSELPVQCSTPSGVIAIAAGAQHNLVLADDGRVWAWGLDENGQLGDGTDGGSSGVATPVKSTDGAGFLSGIVSINGGVSHSLAVGQDGSGWAWGANSNGQLGNDTSAPIVPLPVQVKGMGGVGFLGDISSMTGGQSHSLALLGNGTLFAWGRGLLGIGNTVESTVPAQVLEVGSSEPMTNVMAIASAKFHNLAVKKNGAIAAWGGNYYGELGDGRAATRITPYMVESLQNMTAVSGGHLHSLALKDDGTVWAWGENSYGQLGDGTTEKNSVPQKIAGLSDIKAISAGDYFNLALKDDGTVWAWGRNDHGQLCIDSTDNDPHTNPIKIDPYLTGIKAVAAGGTHALALDNNGYVKAWGNNLSGQLGGGPGVVSLPNTEYPVLVVGPPPGNAILTNIYKIAAGGLHSLAINNSLDRLWTWGDDNYGQLADGLPEENKSAAIVAIDVSSEDDVYISEISGGSYHTLARSNADRALVSGSNTVGQLGDGTKDDRADEYKLSGPAYTSKVAAGGKHSLALTRDSGSVWAWGFNVYGQLGDGTKTEKLSPNLVPGISNITQIAAGGSHSLALMGDGTVWTWGSNEYGQIGDGRVWNERVWVEGLSLANNSPWVIFLPAILKKEQ